ncbi:MAG: hypothetical protein ACXWWC_08330 [Chitinophagaceae bacterium]
MTIKTIWLPLIILSTCTCNNEGKKSPEIIADTVISSSVASIDSLPSGCYAQIINRDTSLLQLEQKANTVNGTLSYNIYQKDRNDGTLQADVAGDIITGWYLFRSEGVVSVRQVSWKINGDELWPGIGEVVQKNDTMLFAQPEKLQYDNTRPFKKVACVI